MRKAFAFHPDGTKKFQQTSDAMVSEKYTKKREWISVSNGL